MPHLRCAAQAYNCGHLVAYTRRTFVPCVRVTSVLPTLRLENMLGALTSYQSFFENGSTLQPATAQVRPHTRQQAAWAVPTRSLHASSSAGRRRARTSSSFLPSSPWRYACSCRPPSWQAQGLLVTCALQELSALLGAALVPDAPHKQTFAAYHCNAKASTALRCSNLCSATNQCCTSLA